MKACVTQKLLQNIYSMKFWWGKPKLTWTD